MASWWDNGVRDFYAVVNPATGVVVEAPSQHPWFDAKVDWVHDYQVRKGEVVVRHSYFGTRQHVTLIVCPEQAPAMLPRPIEVTDDERGVLSVTAGYLPAFRKEYFARLGLTPTAVETAKASLMSKGMLTKAGAITPKGRNAISGGRS